ncbi:hypothetical protein Rhopal_001183-T1 [Rhodotorula paludigena]|uniref:SH3 domain-containing protein n=1 Tax=Rhodotorula paludigena TaxID=86838 RepID=A0AAV5GD45_9BASI|nr:hypothetical protein Rhopal_001183-T1 [Rhodotorula paludigena]
MPNNPLPVNLPQECRKAQKILDAFANPHNGLDDIIPASVLRRAKGFCFMSVAKAGFLFSGRAGTGVVIARLDDGAWSAPSAVGTVGAGMGFQAGVELAEFLIILNSRAAVKSFMSAGSLTVGGNMSIAAGPLGRNVEGTGALSAKGKVAAMYSYSRTKGLFGGASIEGSVIVERSDANAKAYGSDVTVTQLLSGHVDPPQWALPLISSISRLATPARSLPGGGWSTSSPLDTPPAASGWEPYDEHAIASIDADEESYFSRARRAHTEDERRDAGLSPREYRAHGYAFGGANGMAAQGSGSNTPELQRERGAASGGGFKGMLGAVGRSRSGSAASSFVGGLGGKKSSKPPPAADAGDDPFAGGVPALASSSSLALGAGTSRSAAGPFSSRIDDHFDFAAANGRASPTFSRERDLGSFSGGGGGGGDVRDRFDDYPSDEPEVQQTSSRKDSPIKNREGRSASTASSSGAGAGGWFSKAAGGVVRPKLTKSRSSTLSAGAGGSSGLRDRASAMQWGDSAGTGAPRDSFDSLDERDDRLERDGFLDDDARGDELRKREMRDRAQRAVGRPDAGGRFRASTLGAAGDKGAGAQTAAAARARSASSPFADSARGGGGGGYGARPWDDDHEQFVAERPNPPFAAASSSSSSPVRSRSGSGTASALDLRPVEADFESVLSLSKYGGDGEVGRGGQRSRSSTVNSSSAGGTVTGGRSRSGTGASSGGGIGKAVALFDFPGVEPTDLPFKKNDVITILAMDDAEWWKGRLRLREGMVPRNYLEAHLD